MPSKYKDEEKAKAQALIRSGVPAKLAAMELSIPERTVNHWAHRWRQIAAEEQDRELLDEDYRIARQAGALLQDAMDYLAEQDPEILSKHLIPLNAIRGTAVDKIIKRQQGPTPSQHQGPFVIFYQQCTHEPIEAIDITTQEHST